MKMDLSIVPYGMLSGVLLHVLPYLKVSEDWSKGRASVDDILRFLFTGQMQLWIALDDTKIYGHIITEVKQYPQCKMLVIQYCAGESNHMQFVEEKAYEILERFAKDNGCAGIELIGRPGWSRHVAKQGFNTKSVMYQKFFERGKDEPK